MPSFLRTATAVGLVAMGLSAATTAEAASLAPPALAKTVVAMEGADTHLVGGRHWRGGPPPGRYWHRSGGYRHHDRAAIALGAVGAVVGLSALAAANAYPPPAYAYAPPVYDEPYDDDDEAYMPYEEPEAVYDEQAGEPYAPPPPPSYAANPAARNYASAEPVTSGAPEPWSSSWYDYCQSKYRSFNPQTGYFTAYSGEQKFCR